MRVCVSCMYVCMLCIVGLTTLLINKWIDKSFNASKQINHVSKNIPLDDSVIIFNNASFEFRFINHLEQQNKNPTEHQFRGIDVLIRGLLARIELALAVKDRRRHRIETKTDPYKRLQGAPVNQRPIQSPHHSPIIIVVIYL